ncbi:MAG: hypothetical protein M1838_000655 [Thelocarpon superellum]|nr:MAG: hypothetical protein M1838_000655 [Thelocarpon superellum]
MYGRVFTLSWFGFLIAFWSWYAFPPLLTITIKYDLGLTQTDVSNSNIISLVATLLVRLVAGTACDRFGPRWTFAGCLIAGAIPTALAGAVTNVRGLLALRFFVGILGGTFVPCQVWTTAFFDKDVVGTANAFTAGLGNAGGGITYFVMPAIFDSLVSRQHLTPHVAWRVAFVVPFILIVATAIVILVACPDTPTGKWSERGVAVHHNVVRTTDVVHAEPSAQGGDAKTPVELDGSGSGSQPASKEASTDLPSVERATIGQAEGEVIELPTLRSSIRVMLSPHTLVLGAAYFCSFGAELSINSILGAYYLVNFPKLGQTGTGDWAAMFGLLNAVCRPTGGIVSDALFRPRRSLWAKKMLIHLLAMVTGAFMLAIGLKNSHTQSTMFGLVAGMAFFLEAGNGANFSLEL